jgi:hypothetical protein
MLSRFSFFASALVVGLLTLLLVPTAQSCPFCTSQGQTLLGEVGQANLIVFGKLKNAKLDPAGELGNRGTTDVEIELVVKPHDVLGNKKTITIPRYVPEDPKSEMKYLVFIEVLNGKLDPYRGEAVKKDSKIGEYLKGSIALKEKDVASRLTYFFGYLDSEEATLSADAYMEFGNADYVDFRKMAEKINPEVVAKWLRDPNTPASRYGLYGSMLGHCGNKAKHAEVFREILEDPKKRFTGGMDGLLAGYIMIDPEKGMAFLKSILSDDKQEFLLRYAALRTIRFFWEFRNDLVSKEKCVEGMALLLTQGDIADLAVDDLRRWKRWEMTEKVLKLFELESHNVPIVKRSLVRYALSSPKDNKPAQEFLKKMRDADAEWVAQIEELLKLEEEPVKK